MTQPTESSSFGTITLKKDEPSEELRRVRSQRNFLAGLLTGAVIIPWAMKMVLSSPVQEPVDVRTPDFIAKSVYVRSSFVTFGPPEIMAYRTTSVACHRGP